MLLFVGHASQYGSTKEIAERIGARLVTAGIDADVRAIGAAPALASYDGIILGSAIHDGSWLAEASEFVKENLDALSGQPLWLFSVSSIGEQSSAFPSLITRLMLRSLKEPKGLAPLWGTLAPRAHHRFAGVVKREHWGGAGSVFMKLLRGRFGDLRNWTEVDNWADQIAAELTETSRTG